MSAGLTGQVILSGEETLFRQQRSIESLFTIHILTVFGGLVDADRPAFAASYRLVLGGTEPPKPH